MIIVPFTSEKIAKINDKLKVKVDIDENITNEMIIKYTDGKELRTDGKMGLDELEKKIFKHAELLNKDKE